MSALQWLANLLGVALIIWITWYFWLRRDAGMRVSVVGGIQEADVLVKGGYEPGTITVKAGVPVRLNFTRRESSLCSEMVVFETLGRSEKLPEGRTVPFEFTPAAPGVIPFQCQMGMLRGKVIVTA